MLSRNPIGGQGRAIKQDSQGKMTLKKQRKREWQKIRLEKQVCDRLKASFNMENAACSLSWGDGQIYTLASTDTLYCSH